MLFMGVITVQFDLRLDGFELRCLLLEECHIRLFSYPTEASLSKFYQTAALLRVFLFVQVSHELQRDQVG